MAESTPRETEIWAVGGGKGGVGKSFVISNVAQHLARSGRRIVLVDADLGGANLHSFFGVERPETTLSDFFEKSAPLESLIIETGIPNLGLLVGALDSLGTDHIPFSQKMKLFRHIRKLDADFILIDIGAGTHFHAVDSFLLADTLIAVVVPEIIAIENLYYFFKNVYYRKLVRTMAENGQKTLIAEVWKNRQKLGIGSVRQLAEHLQSRSQEAGKIVASAIRELRFNIVVNKIRRRQDIKVGYAVKSICSKYFGLMAAYSGYIEYDELVSWCINKRRPYLQSHSGSRCSGQLEAVAENLVQGRAMR
ncbi:MAG: AAA family ATPase [Desulfobacterales bacterium]|jgi:flagellar biosynthesis protein FlhG